VDVPEWVSGMTRNHVGWNKKLKLSMELSDSWGIHVAYYILKKII
jgi:hypothetical protein